MNKYFKILPSKICLDKYGDDKVEEAKSQPKVDERPDGKCEA